MKVTRSCVFSVLIFAAILFSISCSRGVPQPPGEDQATQFNLETEQKAVERVVKSSIGWALNKNTELLYSCFRQDENLFWFNPTAEPQVGFESFVELVHTVFMNEAFKAISYDVRDLQISLSKSGDAAWYHCILDDINTWNGHPAEWINCRWTGVLEKEEDGWKIVQQHFSFAQPQ